jgi:dolichol-phosphate mannosyltransferase
MSQPLISLIVPTLNEAESLPLLVPRVATALAGREWELLIVDDASRDNTPEVAAALEREYPVRMLVRSRPENGLSGAVLHGMHEARGDLLVVMDADLQHPPEKLPALLEVLESGRGDFALGSRYEAGGSMEESWGAFRRLNSSVATLLARPFAGRVKDPMSGFFALRRRTFEAAQRLTPLGYKIALELICKCRVQRVVEVPIHFGLRQRGESKLSLKQQFHYLEHLSRLYDFTFPRLSPVVKFLIVLLVGGAAAALVTLLLALVGAPMLETAAMAYAAHLAVTALFHLRYIRTQREFLLTKRPWADFTLIALTEMLCVLVAATWLLWRVPDPGRIELLLLTLLAGTLARYAMRKELLQDIRGLRQTPREQA